MSGPLTGLKVVEMNGLGPCPLAGQLMADLGADVVVVDRKSGSADKHDINRRGKRSVALNLKSPEGVAAVGKLIETADILIEGFRPGVMEKLGLGPDDCLNLNPKLVYGRMTGWGQTGPESMTAGHDINYLALTGILAAIGKRDEPPIPPINMVADYGGGTMFLLLGVLSALFEAGRSGKGQVVDAAMTEGASAMTGLLHWMRGLGHWADRRESNILDGGAPYYRCYETADGLNMAIGCVENHFYAEFVRLAGLPESHVAEQNDIRLWPQRTAEYAVLFKTKTRDEWTAIFQGTDACVTPVMELSELTSHPHAIAREVFTDVDGVIQASPAPRFSRTQPAEPAAPHAAGSHTAQVLSEVGFSDQDIEKMKSAGTLT